MGYHVSIMLDECLDALKVEKDKLYFDGTLGGGGHSLGIMRKGGRVIAADRDQDALDYAAERFKSAEGTAGKYTLVKDNFKNVKDILRQCKADKLDGAILDLGISSHQIDEAERGFSYINNAILDMRMDREQVFSAMTVVNEYSAQQLENILFTYGEERYARRIVKAILAQRAKGFIETTAQLAEIVKSSVPFSPKGGHPAKKTFQAIRIEVNGELKGLSEALCDIVDSLKKGARFCVITFHSLEDRIVKQTFKLLSTDCICDKSLPVCVCNHKAEGRLVEHKGVKPTDREQQENSRSKSATLRIIEKL